MPLASMDCAANTDNLVYQVGAGKRASVNLNLCSRGTAMTVRVAVTSGGAPAVGDYVEYDLALAANGTLERTQIFLAAGERIYVRPSAAGLSAAVWGPEEPV